MDRFLDEKNIVKKNNASLVQNNPAIMQKAQHLRNVAQQKLNIVAANTENIATIPSSESVNINGDELMQNIVSSVNNTSMIIEQKNNQQLNQNNTQNISENNNIENKKRNIAEGLLEDINTNKYTTDILHDIQQPISPQQHTNIDTQMYQHNNSHIQKVNSSIKKRITSKEMLLQKQDEAYNKLLDYQVEFEICSKMSVIVEDKLKTTYRTRLKDYQSKITEQEQRIKVIKQLLN